MTAATQLTPHVMPGTVRVTVLGSFARAADGVVVGDDGFGGAAELHPATVARAKAPRRA